MPSPLAWQTIDIPLGGGQDESAHPFLLNAPASSEVTNGRFSETGAIEKRYGYGYTDFTPTDTPHTLLAHGSQRVVVTTSGKTYRYDADNSWDLLSAPRSSAAVADRETHAAVPVELKRWGIVRSENVIGYCDVAIGRVSGLACYVWLEIVAGTSTVYTMITDADTGRVVDGPTALPFTASGAWYNPRVVDVGSRFVLLVLDTNDLKSYYLETSTSIGTWTAGATVGAGAGARWDVCRDMGGTYCHVVWGLAASVQVRSLSSAGAVVLTTSLAQDGSTSVSVVHHAADNDIWIGHCGPTTAAGVQRWAVLNADYSVASASATVAAIAGGGSVYASTIVPTTAGTAWIAWQEEAGANARRCVRLAAITNGGLAYAPFNLMNYAIAAQGFYDAAATRPMFPVCWQPDDGTTNAGRVLPTTQPLGMVIAPHNVSSSVAGNVACVTRFAVDRMQWAFDDGVSVYGKRNYVPGSASYTDGSVTRYLWVNMVRGESSTVQGLDAFSVGLSAVPLRKASYEGCEYLAAGSLLAYDGLTIQENTPHLFPEGVSAARTAGTLADGTYYYKVVWEWEDAQGVLRRSAPSAAATGTATGGGSTLTVTFKTQQVRARDGASAQNWRAALYRTAAGGSTYYLVTRAVPTSGAIAGDVYFADQLADATLTAGTNETLYTTGGELEVAAAPPSLDVLVHKQRCWVIDAERRSEVAYSKLLDQVTTAPEFVGEFRIKLPRGEATALAALDDKIVIFTADDIFVVYGEGPNDTGTLGAFSEPQAVATGVGCTDRCSVVSGDFGVMFRSRRGIELLNRSLQVVPGFGEPVQSTLTSANVITSAVLVPAQNQVRFTRASSLAPLVYDYQAGAWSAWLMNDTPLDAAMVGGTYVWQAANATYAETTAYTDTIASGTFNVDFSVTTPWIKLSGLQGYKRVRRAWLLGRHRGSTGYRWELEVHVDYAGSSVQSEQAQALSSTTNAVFQQGIHLARQKVESLRFVWRDQAHEAGAEVPVYTTVAGITLVSIALEVGGKKGLFKLPAAQKT
jgi:hypothetical protein